MVWGGHLPELSPKLARVKATLAFPGTVLRASANVPSPYERFVTRRSLKALGESELATKLMWLDVLRLT